MGFGGNVAMLHVGNRKNLMKNYNDLYS